MTLFKVYTKATLVLLLLISQIAFVAAQRDIKFLATADPQYENDPNATDFRKAERALTDATMGELNALLNTGIYSGLIVAGDLTMWSRRDEFWAYEKAREPMKDLYYEGLGNHDLYLGGCDAGFWVKCPEDIEKDVKRTKRAQYVNGQKKDITLNFLGSLPHYSWDWEDVHFVQLNLFPGMRVEEKNGNKLDPKSSFFFLAMDLATKVGNSGRPVVLTHHYHIGASEWNDAEKKDYWDLISNYNVIAIITGHAHWPVNTSSKKKEWNYAWPRPVGTAKGPNQIPTFVVGAALAGRYTTFYITEDKMKVTYRGAAKGAVKRIDGDAYVDSDGNIKYHPEVVGIDWAPVCVEYPLDKDSDRNGTPCSEEKEEYRIHSLKGSNDGDDIRAYSGPSPNAVPSDRVEVCLEVGEASTGWWKGLGLNTKNPTIAGDRGDGIQCTQVSAASTNVYYWKAKGFGVHDPVGSEAIDLSNAGGKRFTIKWVKD